MEGIIELPTPPSQNGKLPKTYKRWQCAHCDGKDGRPLYTGYNKSCVRRHLKSKKHRINDTQTLCLICYTLLRSGRDNWCRHLREMHIESDTVKKECIHCQSTMYERNLRTHYKTVHKLSEEEIKTTIGANNLQHLSLKKPSNVDITSFEWAILEVPTSK